MKKNKINHQEIAISRVIIMLFFVIIMIAGVWLYVLPFKKQSAFKVYDHYEIIVMISSFLFMILTMLHLFKSKKTGNDISSKIVTPNMLVLCSALLFIGSIVIPFSGDRASIYKYVILAYIFFFITYAVYYFVGKFFSFQAVICGVFTILLLLLEKYYPTSVHLGGESISVSYSMAILFLSIVILLAILLSCIMSRKFADLKIWHTALLSIAAICSIIERLVLVDYYFYVAVISQLLLFVLLVAIEKLKK